MTQQQKAASAAPQVEQLEKVPVVKETKLATREPLQELYIVTVGEPHEGYTIQAIYTGYDTALAHASRLRALRDPHDIVAVRHFPLTTEVPDA